MLVSLIEWDPKIGIGEVLALLGIFVAAISILYAGRQLGQNGQELQLTGRVARAQFLSDVTERYFSDKEMVEFFYRLDYPNLDPIFEFDPATFPGSKEERLLDKLLYTYDLVGQLVQLEVLTFDEVRLFAFQASRVLQNQEVQKYLAWLEIQYKKYGDPPLTPHEDALSLAEELLGTEIDYGRYKRLYAPSAKRKIKAEADVSTSQPEISQQAET